MDPGTLGYLFVTRGIYLSSAGRRRSEGAAYCRDAARLARQAGDHVLTGRVLLDLSDALAVTDLAAAVEASRTAAGHLRRAGARGYLPAAIANLAYALLLFQARQDSGLATGCRTLVPAGH